jgi:3-dehydroquinate synthetase
VLPDSTRPSTSRRWRARESFGASILPQARRWRWSSDENVAAAGHLTAAAPLTGIASRPSRSSRAGRGIETLAEVERIAGACVAGGLDRKSAIVAIGGGVVGDLAGFVAAILYRGIACAQLPTTLLAMVDSAIGGKTGVDLAAGKNLAGAFWQPRFVLSDAATLRTLAPRELTAAWAEVLKYGLIGDAELFAELEAGGAPESAEELGRIVARCAAHKARVVAADERETLGLRAVLNLGHTVGHAVERASEYRLLHGEAVAVGLVAAAEVSVKLGLAPAGLDGRVAAALRRCGLAADLDPWRRREIIDMTAVDKKRQAGQAALHRPHTRLGAPNPSSSVWTSSPHCWKHDLEGGGHDPALKPAAAVGARRVHHRQLLGVVLLRNVVPNAMCVSSADENAVGLLHGTLDVTNPLPDGFLNPGYELRPVALNGTVATPDQTMVGNPNSHIFFVQGAEVELVAGRLIAEPGDHRSSGQPRADREDQSLLDVDPAERRRRTGVPGHRRGADRGHRRGPGQPIDPDRGAGAGLRRDRRLQHPHALVRVPHHAVHGLRGAAIRRVRPGARLGRSRGQRV